MADNANQQPSGDGPSGNPPDGPGGGNSSGNVTWSGATSITSAGTYDNATYSSTIDAQCALLVSLSTGSTVTLNNPTVQKIGGPTNASDNYNFYGINSGIIALGGGAVSIIGGNFTTNGVGANAVFSYGGNGGQNSKAGDGTTIYIEDATIKTSLSGSGGIMTTGGGKTIAKNLTIETDGQSSAPIRTDRGGGNVTVTGGTYTSNGLGSPAIYSTAEIVVNNATLTSNLSEGICIEGQNSVALTNCTLTANNTQTNGNAQFLDAIMIYQSQSGDAADGTSTFTMTGGTLVNQSGHIFHVTNTTAIINLNNVTINDSGSGILLSVCDDGWSGASNIATLNASSQTLSGDILVGDDSTLTLNISNSSTFTGNISGVINNASGTSISTSVGTVNVSLDAKSKWYLSGDTYITSFEGTAANVINNGFTLYENGTPLIGTTDSEESDSKLITLTSGDDIYENTVDGATIRSFEGADSISNNGASVSIDAGDGNDTIKNTAANVTIKSDSGDNFIMNNNSGASSVLIETGSGVDLISNTAAYVTIKSGAGNDSVFNNGGNAFIELGEGDDSLTNFWSSNLTIDAGAGDNFVLSANGSNSSITASSGNDTISNNSGSNVTITSGAGDDSINNVNGSAVSIDAGAGDDYIYNTGSKVSLTAGAGNDSISLSGASSILFYTLGDGSDSIFGFEATSTLSISGGTYSSLTSGEDLILKVGEDNITLVGAMALSEVNIEGTFLEDSDSDSDSDDEHIENKNDNVKIEAGVGNDTVNNEGNNVTINGGTGSDSIINDGTNVTISGGKGSDTISLNSAALLTYADGDGNDSIVGFDANSTLSISGNNYSTQTSDSDLIVTVGDGKITLSGAATLSTLNIVSDFPSGLNYSSDKTTLTADETFSDAVIDLKAYDREVQVIDASALSSDMTLVGNNSSNTLISGSGNDELTGGDGSDVFVYSGGSDTITDYEKSDKISLSTSISDIVISDGNVILTFDENNSLTLSKAADKRISFLAGNKNYFANHASIDSSKAGATLTSTATDFVASISKLVTINAAGVSAAVNVVGNARANVILAGAHGATLDGGRGKDTLIGGSGADVFIYNRRSGNKVIENYGAGDVISLVGATLTDASIKNDDVILKVGGNKITVKGAASEELTLSEEGTIKYFSDNVIFNAAKTSAKLVKKYSASREKIFDASVTSIDASEAKKTNLVASAGGATILGGTGKDTLTGGTDSDYLVGGKGSDYLSGGEGDDTLWGGKGNDTLIGGDGADEFIYNKGDGKDVIIGFENDDLLRLSDAFKASVNAAKTEINFKVGSGSLTLRDFTATSFNVNGDTYRISGKTLVRE